MAERNKVKENLNTSEFSEKRQQAWPEGGDSSQNGK